MASLNKVVLVGNLGRDPELKSTPSGAKVLEVSIATTERFSDKSGNQQEQTDWHRIVMWNQKAEYVARSSRKGSTLYVEGKLRYRKFTDKDGNERTMTEILADNVTILAGRVASEGGAGGSFAGEQPQYHKPYNDAPAPEYNGGGGFSEAPAVDDNLPF
ncbi:MAG: single-stranded DNA-binding protein [Chitinivibrionia bacterium]|nr:single-stranded DNA-binding protein [Chitinivibrionia bacterium]